MTTWNADIAVYRGDELLGRTSVKDIVTEALPRVGEHVAFARNAISPLMQELLQIGFGDAPVVTRVLHWIDQNGTVVHVTVRVKVVSHVSDAKLEQLPGWSANKEG